MKNILAKLMLKLILKIIELLDSSEKSDEKLIKSFELDGVEVLSESGFVPASHIHLTKPFEIYTISLENGISMQCADEHLVFTPEMRTVWVKDLKKGQEVLTEEGPTRVLSVTKSDTKVCMCDLTVDSENHSYYTNGILSHNTTTSAIYMLHYILFNYDKNALIVANKRATAVEILDKLKKIYLELPYYLKPGIYKWNESSIALDNGSRIMAEATTENSGIGFTLHCVLADEFAHVPPNIMDKFYNNLFPTITAGKAKFIISSTQNGYNLFQRLYTAAEMGENDYAPFKVDWWQVPEWNPDTKKWEKRDEVWYRRQVGNLGGEEAFNKQFGTKFDLFSNTLISGKILKQKDEESIEFTNKELIIENCSDFFWKPDYEPVEDLRKDWIVITIDISEGVNGDYTVFMFNRLVYNADGDPNIEAVGYFRCNTIDISKSAQILKDVVSRYCCAETTLICVERNMYGDLFMKYVLEYIERSAEKDMRSIDKFNEYMFIKSKRGRGGYQWGIQMNAKTKLIACKVFKERYERGIIVNRDHKFIVELQNFGDAKGNNTYKAILGHDDIVMAQMQIVLAQDTNTYKNFIKEFEFYQGASKNSPDTSYNGTIYDYSGGSNDSIYGFGSYIGAGSNDSIYGF